MKKKLKKFFHNPRTSIVDSYKKRSFQFISLSESYLKINIDSIDSEITRLVPELKRNDKDLLNDISYSIITLNYHQFQKAFDALCLNLINRTRDFNSQKFAVTRFDGWCSVLCNLTGMYGLANQHFLEEKGVIFPDDYYDSLDNLVKVGVSYLIKKQGKVTNLLEWEKIEDSYYKNSRKYLANSLNYLARDAYKYSRSSFKVNYNVFLSRYDVLAESYVFGNINIVDENDEHLLNLYSIHSQLKDYLRNNKNYSFAKGLFITNQSKFFKKIFYIFVNLSVKLFKTKDVLEFKSWYYSPYRNANFTVNILPLLPVIYKHIEEFPYFCDRFSKLVEHESIAMRLEKLKFNVHIGRLGHIEKKHLFLEKINHAQLGEIHGLLNILTLVSLDDKLDIISLIESRLKHFRYSHGHNVNYSARIVQLQNFKSDIQNQVLLDKAYKISLHPVNNQVVKDSDNVVLFALNQCRIAAPMMSGISKILKDHNYKFFSLEEHYEISSAVPKWLLSPTLSSDFMGCKGVASNPQELLNNGWFIDLEGSKLVLDGVNYYQGMYERVSRVLKVFNVPWHLPVAQLYFTMWLIQIDRVIYALKEVKKVAIEKNLKIILVSAQSHFVPYSAMKTYAIEHSEQFSHVTLNSSYENWKTNVGGEPLSTLTFINNSRHAYPSVPAFGNCASFEKWYKEIYVPFKYYWDNERSELLSMKRSGSTEYNILHEEIYSKIKLAKASGRKVFCAIGKIPYDLGVPYQGGPAHSNMNDWIDHTVRIIEGSDNLLLIKPHPHELKTEISGKPVEGFLDLISNKDELRNTICLPHVGMNLQDLFEYVDVFICWNGSSIAELGAQGKNVIACDDWAKYNYPIEVYLPKNRTHYCNILKGKAKVRMHPEFFVKSEAYTVYLTQAPFAIRYNFATRSSTNIRFNEAKIRLEAFNRRSFDKLANRSDEIIECFS